MSIRNGLSFSDFCKSAFRKGLSSGFLFRREFKSVSASFGEFKLSYLLKMNLRNLLSLLSERPLTIMSLSFLGMSMKLSLILIVVSLQDSKMKKVAKGQTSQLAHTSPQPALNRRDNQKMRATRIARE